MLTKDEVGEIYANGLVLGAENVQWVPVSFEVIQEKLEEMYGKEFAAQTMIELEGSKFEVNQNGVMRRITSIKSYRILPIEGGEIEGLKFSTGKSSVSKSGYNSEMTWYDVIIDGKNIREKALIKVLRQRNKLFYATAGTDKCMKTEKICPHTGAELWYPPMLSGIYIQNSAYIRCLTPKFGHHVAIEFSWDVGEVVLCQAIENKNKNTTVYGKCLSSLAQKLLNILNMRQELAEANKPAAWELAMLEMDAF